MVAFEECCHNSRSRAICAEAVIWMDFAGERILRVRDDDFEGER